MNIPGYYFDKEKNRYFRVEQNGTAPSSASWAANAVKRRKVQDAAAEETRRYEDRAAGRIKRSFIFDDGYDGYGYALGGGLYKRETAGLLDPLDLPARWFGRGLRRAGGARLFPPGSGRDSVPCCMYVGVSGGMDMCTVHASPLDGQGIYYEYLARNEKKRIDKRVLANYRLRPLLPADQEGGRRGRLPLLTMATDIKYHEPSNLMLVSSRDEGAPTGGFRVALNDDDDDDVQQQQRWIDPTANASPEFRTLHDTKMEAYTVAPAPVDSSSHLVCVWGTNKGIVLWNNSPGGDPRARMLCSRKEAKSKFLGGDVFAIDYLSGQSQVLRFGGRAAGLVSADMREPSRAWTYVRLASAVTHVRCIERQRGGDCVLVAGLGHTLGVYDMRFARLRRVTEDDDDSTQQQLSSSSSSSYHHHHYYSQTRRHKAVAEKGHDHHDHHHRRRPQPRKSEEVERPVICFEKYRNEAHTDIGFAYDASTGVVAAAHDNGTVALYSVRSGKQLHRYTGLGGRGTDVVVRALQFQTFPSDRMPSLFVGAGGGRGDGDGDANANVKAFSMDVGGMDEES
ncbi:hypothetical protein F5Y17DRAFT_101248 [Xylariaceae sp. FL0594]|nr:hypothetical protein F5Y17DRAFT_101248 [Xylariaceae sp. FL0594]